MDTGRIVRHRRRGRPECMGDKAEDGDREQPHFSDMPRES